MSDFPTEPAPLLPDLEAEEALARARSFADEMARRRTIRDFAPDPVPDEVIREAVRAAGTAPSGAHVQPWRFVVVRDPERKRLLREGAEEEERRWHPWAPTGASRSWRRSRW